MKSDMHSTTFFEPNFKIVILGEVNCVRVFPTISEPLNTQFRENLQKDFTHFEELQTLSAQRCVLYLY